MAQLLVRHLDPSVKEALQRRAQRHGRSMEEEVQLILRAAAEADQEPSPISGLGTRMAELFKGVGLEDPIPEWGGQGAKFAEWP